MMYGWYGGWGGGWWIAMAAMMVIFWGGLAAVVLLIRGARWSRGGYAQYRLPPEDPEHILAQRFARCEIDEAEYKSRLNALRRSP